MAQYSTEVQELLTRIDSLQAQIEALKPISPEQVNKIFQKYRLDWNYNSNSIEGNSLSYGETVAFIMEGLTAKGKPLKDHLDIKGHNEAIDFLVDMQEKGSELTERDIRSLHQMILVEPYKSEAQTADGHKTSKTINLGVYKSSPNHVITATGQTHYYATPEETPALMQELMTWYRENKGVMHPLVLSTLFHHRFVGIHPFDDGNGRMSRLLSNLMLMQAGLPPVVVRKDQRSEYYGVLSQADAGVTDPLLGYFAELLIRALEIYLKGAQGGDISDPSDLDKEIALFVAGFDEEVINKVQLDQGIIDKMNDLVIAPIFKELVPRFRKINALFFEYNVKSNIYFYNSDNAKVSELNYGRVDAEEFYNIWIGAEALKNALSSQFSEKYPKDGSIRIVFRFIYSGFKAKESAKPIEVFMTLDLERSHYVITPFDNEGEEVVKQFYPKPISSIDLQKVSSQFFKGLMGAIKTAYEEEV